MISVMPVPLLAVIHGNVAHKVVLDMYRLPALANMGNGE